LIGQLAFGWSLRDPWWLTMLALVPIVWFVRSRGPAVPFAAARLLVQDLAGNAPLPASFRQRLAWLPEALATVALALGILAMARPIERVPLPPERAGIDVLLCIDTSSSMAATDLGDRRTRLDIVGEVAAAFVQQRANDRTGFVSFARYADLRCPPTLDHAATAELLRAVKLVGKDSPEDATGIGNAVAQAAAVLRRSKAASKVIVLLTDGEENVATAATPQEVAPVHAAQLCARLGVRVHTIVVGQGNQKPDGRFVALDTKAVREVAEVTGGKFFTARDVAGLQRVYDEIDALEKVEFAEPRVLTRELFAWPLAAAILLLGFGRWLVRRTLAVLP
jgi:Ca-activated chloride channel family protein